MSDPRAAVEHAARDAYGRLLAWLSSRSRDVALAEDVLGDALEAALLRWPIDGVPAKPEAWLLTVSRRKLIDRRRRGDTRTRSAEPLLAAEKLQREAMEAEAVPFRAALPDRRLELLFVCAHPEIPRALRAPLMLQTVLGLDAATIGSAMLVAPATMGQRLVRAKRRIREAGLPFEVPVDDLEARTGDVLEAVYAAYGAGWEADPDLGSDPGLANEALWLARLLVELLPQSGEAKGLYALLCFCESRRGARRASERYVPLEEQDTARWNSTQIKEGEAALWLASKLHQSGPFQLEAAIQSIHADRARTGQTDWRGVHNLYHILIAQHPSLGAWVGYAASLGRLGRAADAVEVLDGLDPQQVARYQPYWAVRGWLRKQLGQDEETRAAFKVAMGLAADPAVRRWLAEQ